MNKRDSTETTTGAYYTLPKRSIDSSSYEVQALGIEGNNKPSVATIVTTASIGEKPEDKYFYCNFFRKKRGNRRDSTKIHSYKLEECKTELIECCLTHMQDSYKVHLNRLQGLAILEVMMGKFPIDSIDPPLAVHMVWACLSCIHHFLLRMKTSGGSIPWLRKRQARKVLYVYDRLLNFLFPQYFSVVLQAVITFFEEANLWDIEQMGTAVFRSLLLHTSEYSLGIEELLNLVENSTLTNPNASRRILQVFHDVEESLRWSLLDTKLILRILDMYYNSVTPDVHTAYNYEVIEKGLELCVRGMTRTFEDSELMEIIKLLMERTILEEITDEHLMNFGSLLEHISTCYHIKSPKRTMPDKVFPLILKLLVSDNILYSLLGNRILQHLTDRHSNILTFDTPRIFFEDAHYNITLGRYRSDDKEFFRRHRQKLHSALLTAVLKHGVQKVHLENSYSSMAIYLVEIPCGYTAAAGVCFAMALQESALENPNIEMTHAHRLHATVLSLISLICHIHGAEVFYSYVSTIIERRAHHAPHLNPPLKMNYKYAQHHVLWNKPELFFEDWEARYGLWKCFRSKRTNLTAVLK